MCGGGYLCEPIMHLIRNPASLLLLGDEYLADQVLQPLLALGQLPVKPGVLQRRSRLGGQTLQDLYGIVLRQHPGTVDFEHPDGTLPHPQWQEQPYGRLVLSVPTGTHYWERTRCLILQNDFLSLPNL